MKNYKNKGMGIFYGFLIIFINAIGHWVTVQYQDDSGFRRFIDSLKNMVFNYFNSSIPLKVTISVSAVILIMMIISGFWHYGD